MSHLILEDLTLAYGRSAPAVQGLNLSVGEGELVSLLGPSGCGKTTTMRAVAGLLEPQGGRIVLAGRDITAVPAHQRDIGLVFQSYALFPHLSVFENVAFGLRLRRVPPAEMRARVDEALASVGLSAFAQRLPARLSGGQQQRVALARAIVLRPRLLLLDEPLSNLDARLRLEMRAELRRLQRTLGITMLYVTHDQDEALSLSDRIVVMHAGRIEQDAPPQDIWGQPASAFVAGFMGFDNLLPVSALPAAPLAALPAGVTHLAWRAQAAAVKGDGAVASGPAAVLVSGQISARSFLGDRIQYLVETPLGPLRGCGPAAGGGWQEGALVTVELDPAHAACLPAAPAGAPGRGSPR